MIHPHHANKSTFYKCIFGALKMIPNPLEAKKLVTNCANIEHTSFYKMPRINATPEPIATAVNTASVPFVKPETK